MNKSTKNDSYESEQLGNEPSQATASTDLSSLNQASSATPSSYRPELPDWGVYTVWPSAGNDWIHASDLSAALELIPSRRVFKRTQWDNTWYQLEYGSINIRVRPTLWVRVENVDLNVGQQVELLSRNGQNDAGIVFISDILFNSQTQQIEFYLRQRGLTLPKSFTRSDLRPLHVTHQLRTGYFQHQPQKANLPADLELLDVGDLTGEK